MKTVAQLLISAGFFMAMSGNIVNYFQHTKTLYLGIALVFFILAIGNLFLAGVYAGGCQ